jgi:hypothetical protein
MGYAKNTSTPFDGYKKTARTNPARVGAGVMIPSTGGMVSKTIRVAHKPAKNAAAK